jgi:hypothetical protein
MVAAAKALKAANGDIVQVSKHKTPSAGRLVRQTDFLLVYDAGHPRRQLSAPSHVIRSSQFIQQCTFTPCPG